MNKKIMKLKSMRDLATLPSWLLRKAVLEDDKGPIREDQGDHSIRVSSTDSPLSLETTSPQFVTPHFILGWKT
jgi:CO dehydrogenase/acetyl-CoA synthase gamma subunit (corrinoid Fe-S protein)